MIKCACGQPGCTAFIMVESRPTAPVAVIHAPSDGKIFLSDEGIDELIKDLQLAARDIANYWKNNPVKP